MSELIPTGGSRAVQGCLFGAVALFAVLLVVMLLLAYQRFREHTGEPTTTPTTTGLLFDPAEEDSPRLHERVGSVEGFI